MVRSGELVGAYDLRDNNLGTVSLVSGDPVGMVICRLANMDDIPGLNIGDTITVKGECSGMLMDVLVNKCVIIP
ncbi:MAG: hypothetical protein R2744_08820 [Bacteroidales bacterium]